MKIIKYITVWILMIVGSIFMPILNLCGYEAEFELNRVK